MQARIPIFSWEIPIFAACKRAYYFELVRIVIPVEQSSGIFRTFAEPILNNMFTEKQQGIADRILKDVATQKNHVWESDYMSDLRMQFPDNYHDCDYVLQSLCDYRLLVRYGSGFLRLTPEGMEAAERKFITKVKGEERIKKVKRLTDYINLINAVFGGVIGSLLTLLIQKILGII